MFATIFPVPRMIRCGPSNFITVAGSPTGQMTCGDTPIADSLWLRRITGSAGCNLYQAAFGIDLGVLTTLDAGIYCNQPAGVMDQETTYIQILGRVYGFWLTGDQLILNSGLGTLTYRTIPAPLSSDQAYLLQAHPWYLVSYNTTLATPGSAGDASLVFNPNGTLTGYTGCNNLSGNYQTNLSQISTGSLALTKAACPNSVLAAQEKAILDILSSAQTYQVFDTSMQIVGSSGVLNFYFAPVNRPEDIKAPTAVISAPTQANVGQVVTFDASKSTAQVAITSYQWDFGDNGRGSGMIVQHVYNQPGKYFVQMTVTDQRGYRDSESMNIEILPLTQPTPKPTEVNPTTTPLPTATSLPTNVPTATPSQPEPTKVPEVTPTLTEATEPPQPTETQPEPTATQTEPTATQPEPTLPPEPTATLEPPPTEVPPAAPPQAAISGPGQGFPGEIVIFSASGSTAGSSPITGYTWNFGNGATSGPTMDVQSQTIYNQSGTYDVTVVVTDQNGLSSSASTKVTIQARLNTTVWTLNSIGNQNLVQGTTITLQFLNGQIAGFAGCNSYTGSYTAINNGDGTYSVTVSNLAVGKMSCPGSIMNQEQQYITTLTQVQLAQVQGNMLVLNSPAGSLTYYEVGTAMPR